MVDVMHPERVVLRALLERNAAEVPTERCVSFEDGTTWTYRDALDQAYAAANALCPVVGRGGRVVAALPNGAAYLRTWWGAAVLGASLVPLNPAYRGRLVEHLLDLARPDAVVTTPQFADLLRELGRPGPHIPVLDPSDVVGTDRSAPRLDTTIQPWEPISLATTSGSTGPSKLVRVSHAHSFNAGTSTFTLWGMSSSDVYLCDLPLTHVSSQYLVHASLASRTPVVLRTRPDLQHYWEVARDTGATLSQLYGTMANHLEGQPDRGAERSHRLRVVVTVPLPPDPAGFARRFGIGNVTVAYGSTEGCCALVAVPGADLQPGFVGTVLPGWTVRIVDEHDVEVPHGRAGQAIVRSDTPWLMTTEYVDNPVATARAWRNGWFHTGDLMRRDAAGDYFFLDRLDDALRRRGQNVSSFDIEAVVQSYPGVAEAAVVGERSDVPAEDEVKAWVVLDPSVPVDFADLLRFCVERLPHYMVPRYFEAIDSFPKTPGAKIQKNVLREIGSGGATWDRRAAGLDVTRVGVVDIDG